MKSPVWRPLHDQSLFVRAWQDAEGAGNPPRRVRARHAYSGEMHEVEVVRVFPDGSILTVPPDSPLTDAVVAMYAARTKRPSGSARG